MHSKDWRKERMHQNYLSFSPGDVVLVEIPFSNGSGRKLRPGLVVSSDEFNNKSKDIVLLKITGSQFGTEYEVKLTNKWLTEGELKKTSWVDVGFLVTVEQDLVLKRIARVKPQFMKKIWEKMKIIFSMGTDD